MMKRRRKKGGMGVGLFRVAIILLFWGVSQSEAVGASLADNDIEPAEQSDEALPDSVRVTELEDFVVNGRIQRVVKYGVEYIPDKKTKKVSQNASDLLLHMQIPQLKVNPVDSSVKTMLGGSVSVFINYIPATAQDMDGLRPEDVLRVEVLNYPEDPRFGSAANVVNFILVEYEWGGYTKVDGTGSIFGRDNFDGSVYSRFVTGKWTMDASGNVGILHSDLCETDATRIFKNVEYDGVVYPEIVKREQGGKNYLYQSNSQWVSVRMAYNDSTSQILHTLSFNRSGTPRVRNTSDVTYSAAIPASTSYRESGSQSISPAVSGYYVFSLPANNSIVAKWDFSYAENKNHSIYQVGELSEIANSSREKVYAPNGTFQYSQRMGHDNTLRATLITSNAIYNTGYAGSYAGTQKLVSSENMLFMEYMQSWKCGLNLFSRVGVSYVLGRVNGTNELSEWNPRLGFQLSYAPDSKNYLSLEGWWGNSHPSPSSASSALVQDNELLWIQGNPDLRNTLFARATLKYSYMPINEFGMFVLFEYNGNPNKQAREFYDIPGLNVLVSRTINSGNAHRYTGCLGLTGWLLNRSLTLHVDVLPERTVLTGCDAQSMNMLSAYADAQYLRNNWSVYLFYRTPRRYIDAWSMGVRAKYPDSYGIIVNYAVGNFKFGFRFLNWFKTRGFADLEMQSDRYDFYNHEAFTDASRMLGMSIQYTFTYGKKVDRGGEINKISAPESSVLH